MDLLALLCMRTAQLLLPLYADKIYNKRKGLSWSDAMLLGHLPSHMANILSCHWVLLFSIPFNTITGLVNHAC